jgi:para-aminobenzoate synthetase component 1
MPGRILQLASGLGPLEVGQRLATRPGFILLHSSSSSGPHSRYSVAVCEPSRVLIVMENEWRLEEPDKPKVSGFGVWKEMARLVGNLPQETRTAPYFPAGGWFGFLGYELGLQLEDRLAGLRRPEPRLCPDAWLGFYLSCLVWDHQELKLFVAFHPETTEKVQEQERARWATMLSLPPAPDTPQQPTGAVAVSASLSPITFQAKVSAAQRYICAGDVYQVNLSRRLEVSARMDAWKLYRNLLEHSPSPYSAFLNGGAFQLASISPELFLNIKGKQVMTRPIKGTRPRGHTTAEDLALSEELVGSSKDRAELLMITDLLRNDLGKVCQYGSVRVPSLAQVELHAFVQHLVATVTGTLAHGQGHFDVLAACFPGGSITGAPKVRAMELIHELEPVDRGPFTGCLGYFGANGASQFSILIRTALITSTCIRYWAGAGIVADSIPALETEEVAHKSAAFLKALNAEVPL